jgi:hypothetical protein
MFLLGFLRGVGQKHVEKARFLGGISRSFGGHKAVLMRTFFTAEKFASFSNLFLRIPKLGNPV